MNPNYQPDLEAFHAGRDQLNAVSDRTAKFISIKPHHLYKLPDGTTLAGFQITKLADTLDSIALTALLTDLEPVTPEPERQGRWMMRPKNDR